jgi:uracil-DNA glycosylase
MPDLNALLKAIENEARSADFPVETAVYEKCHKDPLVPILYGGSLETGVCFFARDLGKDEVIQGQPLYGAAGSLVRSGIFRAKFKKEPQGQDDLNRAAQCVLLTNTVPYKPPGNKAYSPQVKERFRPFLEEFFVHHFQGNILISLGTEAFQWFTPYAKKEVAVFWKREDRYEKELEIVLSSQGVEKKIRLCPLPHPSPLNQMWYARFPALLAHRLEAIF